MVQSILNLNISDEPIAVRGYQMPIILTELLRSYFTTVNQYWIPALRELVFTSPQGPANKAQVLTNLHVGSFGEYTGDTHNDIPKLLIRRQPVARVPNGWNGGERQVPGSGGQLGPTYEKKWSGGIVIFGMSKIRGESELLAFEVAELLSHFEAKIQNSCTLSAFRCNQVGSVGKIREYPNFFVTPVIVDYAYVDNVQITTDQHPIREIIVSTN